MGKKIHTYILACSKTSSIESFPLKILNGEAVSMTLNERPCACNIKDFCRMPVLHKKLFGSKGENK